MLDLLLSLSSFEPQSAPETFHPFDADIVWVVPDLAAVRAAWPKTLWARAMADTEVPGRLNEFLGMGLGFETLGEALDQGWEDLREQYGAALDLLPKTLDGLQAVSLTLEFDEAALEPAREALRNHVPEAEIEGDARAIDASFAFLGLELPEDAAALRAAVHVVDGSSLIDEFGARYGYVRDETAALGFRLTSLGADGEPGGEGPDRDLEAAAQRLEGSSVEEAFAEALVGLDVRLALQMKSEELLDSICRSVMREAGFGAPDLPNTMKIPVSFGTSVTLLRSGPTLLVRFGSAASDELPTTVELPARSSADELSEYYSALSSIERVEDYGVLWWGEWNGAGGQIATDLVTEMRASSWTAPGYTRAEYERELVQFDVEESLGGALSAPILAESSLAEGRFELRIATGGQSNYQLFGMSSESVASESLQHLDPGAALRAVISLDLEQSVAQFASLIRELGATEAFDPGEVDFFERVILDWFDRIETLSGVAFMEDFAANVGPWAALSVHAPTAAAVPEHAVVFPLAGGEDTFELFSDWMRVVAENPMDSDTANGMRVRRRDMEGRPGLMITPRGVPLVRPSFAVDGDQLVFALTRDALRAHLRGVDERAGTKVDPGLALDGLPGKVGSVVVFDGGQVANELLHLVRTAGPALALLGELPFDPAELPETFAILEGLDPFTLTTSRLGKVNLLRASGSFSYEATVLGLVGAGAWYGFATSALDEFGYEEGEGLGY